MNSDLITLSPEAILLVIESSSWSWEVSVGSPLVSKRFKSVNSLWLELDIIVSWRVLLSSVTISRSNDVVNSGPDIWSDFLVGNVLLLDVRAWVRTIWSVWLLLSSILEWWSVCRDKSVDFLVNALLTNVLLLSLNVGAWI